jgi:putative ATP-binding cassette transporter
VTLRELLVKPGKAATDEQVLAALRAAGLGSLAERAGGLDVEQDWEAFVSLGDLQLLALTRVVLAGPRFVLLDRIDSALGPGQVRQVIQWLSQSSITPIHLAGSAESVDPYDAVLEIDFDGAWRYIVASAANAAILAPGG